MPYYQVNFVDEKYYWVMVRAEDEDEACDLALKGLYPETKNPNLFVERELFMDRQRVIKAVGRITPDEEKEMEEWDET